MRALLYTTSVTNGVTAIGVAAALRRGLLPQYLTKYVPLQNLTMSVLPQYFRKFVLPQYSEIMFQNFSLLLTLSAIFMSDYICSTMS